MTITMNLTPAILKYNFKYETNMDKTSRDVIIWITVGVICTLVPVLAAVVTFVIAFTLCRKRKNSKLFSPRLGIDPSSNPRLDALDNVYIHDDTVTLPVAQDKLKVVNMMVQDWYNLLLMINKMYMSSMSYSSVYAYRVLA